MSKLELANLAIELSYEFDFDLDSKSATELANLVTTASQMRDLIATISCD